jgi:flagellin-like hook-associated protein FlgL
MATNRTANQSGGMMINLTGNLVWVDGTYGNDTAGRVNRFDNPFATIGAAVAAAQAGETVVVYPGTYNEYNLLKDEVNLHFMPGAKVIYSGAVADSTIFDDAGAEVVCRITGHGEFKHNGSGSGAGDRKIFIVSHANSNIYVETVGVSGTADSFAVRSVTAGKLIYKDVAENTDGAVAGTGVTVEERGGDVVHQTILHFTASAFAMVDEAGVVAYAGKKVYDFPAGNIIVLGAVADLDLTKSSAGVNDTWDGDFGIGTVTASNNATLATTEQNIIPTTATPQAVAGVTTANGANTAVAVLDGTATAVDAYVNILVDDADHDVTGTACNIIANGTVTITWVNAGDF